MIEKLTAKQTKQLEVYRNKWVKIGLDTSRANRKAAEKACHEAYKIAGLEAPKMVFCCKHL